MHKMFHGNAEQPNSLLISVTPWFQESTGIKWLVLPMVCPDQKYQRMENQKGTCEINKCEINKAYRPNAHLLYIVMHYNDSII